MWPNLQKNVDMVTFPEEILHGKLNIWLFFIWFSCDLLTRLNQLRSYYTYTETELKCNATNLKSRPSMKVTCELLTRIPVLHCKLDQHQVIGHSRTTELCKKFIRNDIKTCSCLKQSLSFVYVLWGLVWEHLFQFVRNTENYSFN